MNKQTITHEKLAAGWRLRIGATLFVLSILIPTVGVLIVAALGMSATKTASTSGTFVMLGEILGFLAVAVLGKAGYKYIKQCAFKFLKRYAPAEKVSFTRYIIGLVMFSTALLIGWVSPYVEGAYPDFARMIPSLCIAVGGDLILLTGLFVLGGQFWDKIRSLFVYHSEATFNPK